MRHVFYILIFVALLWEIMKIFNPQRTSRFRRTYKREGRRLEWEDWTDSQKSFGLLNIGYMIWRMLGLLTFQWPLFLLLLLISFIPSWKHKITNCIDGILRFCILLFILLNNYHFHIDIWKLIT